MSKKESKYINSVATCSCGVTFDTKSTKDNIHVEVCSECHPFYTGANQNVGGRKGKVEEFNKKYGFNKTDK